MTMPHLMNCRHDENGWCLHCVKAMHDENEELRAALKACRAYMFSQGMTTRRFAEACGISPSQLSEWTAGAINTEPDFVERSREQ